jgi:hypothetical protein
MIVEDDRRKAAAYRASARHYSSHGIEFRVMESAKSAIATLLDPGERSEFDGVIADFGLGGRGLLRANHVQRFRLQIVRGRHSMLCTVNVKVQDMLDDKGSRHP